MRAVKGQTTLGPLSLLFGILASLFAFVIAYFIIQRYNVMGEGAMQAAGGCSNCFTSRLQMEIIGMPRPVDGQMVVTSGEPFLRDCFLKICNCMNSDALIGSMRVRYGTEGFENGENNFEETILASSMMDEAGGFLGQKQAIKGRCEDLFNLFNAQGKFPGTENDNGKAFVRLVYEGEVVSEYEWNVAYRYRYEVTG